MVRAGVCENIIICQPTNQPTNQSTNQPTTPRPRRQREGRNTDCPLDSYRPFRASQTGHSSLSRYISALSRLATTSVRPSLSYIFLPRPTSTALSTRRGREMRYSTVDIQSLVRYISARRPRVRHESTGRGRRCPRAITTVTAVTGAITGLLLLLSTAIYSGLAAA